MQISSSWLSILPLDFSATFSEETLPKMNKSRSLYTLASPRPNEPVIYTHALFAAMLAAVSSSLRSSLIRSVLSPNAASVEFYQTRRPTRRHWQRSPLVQLHHQRHDEYGFVSTTMMDQGESDLLLRS